MVNCLTPYPDADPRGMTLFLFSLRMSVFIYITPLTLAVPWPSKGLAHSPETWDSPHTSQQSLRYFTLVRGTVLLARKSQADGGL